MPVKVHVNDIHKAFKENQVLDGITFDIMPGTICGLIGPSGGGKSILLKIIGGVVRPNSGSLTFEPNSSVQDTSLMFQEGALFDSLCVFDNVAFPLRNGKNPIALSSRESREKTCDLVSEILSRVGLSKAAYKMPAQLSGGMRRRVSLARALVSRPELVLLDDPTSGLDPVASSVIMNLIVELHDDYKPTVLIVSHDLRRLFPVVDKIYGLFNGKICFTGSLSELKACQHSLLRTFAACRYDLAA